jgi:hypothetical protein
MITKASRTVGLPALIASAKSSRADRMASRRAAEQRALEVKPDQRSTMNPPEIL